MKLYATITSERASKGQGGEYLLVDIKDENKNTLWNLHIVQKKGDNGHAGYFLKISDEFMSTLPPLFTDWRPKGKQQKGKEDGVCRICGDGPIDSYEGVCYDCQMKSIK